jgi:hypothetical protein
MYNQTKDCKEANRTQRTPQRGGGAPASYAGSSSSHARSASRARSRPTSTRRRCTSSSTCESVDAVDVVAASTGGARARLMSRTRRPCVELEDASERGLAAVVVSVGTAAVCVSVPWRFVGSAATVWVVCMACAAEGSFSVKTSMSAGLARRRRRQRSSRARTARTHAPATPPPIAAPWLDARDAVWGGGVELAALAVGVGVNARAVDEADDEGRALDRRQAMIKQHNEFDARGR